MKGLRGDADQPIRLSFDLDGKDPECKIPVSRGYIMEENHQLDK